MKNSLKIMALIILLITASGCSLTKKSSTETSATTNAFTDQNSATAMTTTQANLAKAKVAAASWHPDATWVALNFNVPADLNPKSLSQTFVFGSGSDTNNWFTYSIDTSEKFVRAVIPKSDFLGIDLQPIAETYWKTNYISALQTAYANGGNAFIAKSPETQVTLTLSQNPPKNWLWYLITFQAANDAQKIRISANDGKIYDDQGNLSK